MMVSALNTLYLRAKRIGMNARPVTIVTYHSISNTPDQYTVSRDAFARHVAFLAGHYRIARLRDIRTVLDESATNRERSVMVTFDDAYGDFYEAAQPILRKYSVPCTMFVPSGHLGGHNEWDSHRADYVKRSIMTPGQLTELARSGLVDFGSHSVSHASMAELSLPEMRRQARESAESLKTLLGSPITMFSYPYGRFSAATSDVLRETNYDIAVTTKWGTLNGARNLLSLKRITLGERDSSDDIRTKIDGGHDIFYAKGVGSRLRAMTRHP